MFRRYVDLPWGQVHTTEAGEPDGALLLLLHQSPLSSRTYAPLLNDVVSTSRRRLHVVAPDTPGYGGSDPAPEAWTLEDYAAGVWSLVEALGHHDVMLLGQHTGAVIAVEAAATQPGRVRALVLQGLPVYTPEERAERLSSYAPPYVPADDASHLQFIWDRLGRLYPELDADLRTDFVIDYLRAGPMYNSGYQRVFRHELRPALSRIMQHEVPITMLTGEHDLVRFHHERLDPLGVAVEHVVIPGSGDFAPLEQPDVFVSHLTRILEDA